MPHHLAEYRAPYWRVKLNSFKCLLFFVKSPLQPYPHVSHIGITWVIEKRMECAGVMAPVAQRIGALAKSTATYPNIQPGQEFEGYK
jgi:hypothetical protein